MTRVAITELKAKLSEYLSAVRAGEEIVVTDRGRPVARLSPVAGERELEARIAGLVRAGILRPPSSEAPLDVAAFMTPDAEDREGRLRRALIEDRRTGR